MDIPSSVRTQYSRYRIARLEYGCARDKAKIETELLFLVFRKYEIDSWPTIEVTVKKMLEELDELTCE